MENKVIQTTLPTIGSIIRRAEQDYIAGTTTISKYVQFDMYENINKIDAYLNSKHITGDTDSMGREKPFFNICTAAVNIWYRATDIDRKNIRIRATKSSDILGAFLATVHLQEWMRKENFGTFLNEWGRVLARYGSGVPKFVDQGDQLHCMVVPWQRIIVDSVEFYGNPVIEILELTPSQLRRKEEYDQEQVKALIESAKTQRKTRDGQSKDTKDEYIRIYELHGELPLSYITGNEGDDDEYVQQMHVISFTGKKGNYDDYTLFKGREKQNPYLITHLIKEDGRTQSIGAVEHLFEAQWMMNHTAKSIKDQLDLASKLVFQTADGNYVGQNVLTSVENGDIFIHQDNKPLTQLANNSHDIVSLQNFQKDWKVLAQEITSTPDVMMGANMPSGTAYRQAAIIQQESHSNFEIMTENKGLHIEEMMRKFIIPFLKRKMDTSKEIAATLQDSDIAKIDSIFTKSEAVKRHNKKAVEQVLKGEELTGLDIQAEQESIQNELKTLGNQRFFVPSEVSDKTWKEIFGDLEWEAEVEVTDETIDKEAVMTTLSTVLQSIVANPSMLQDPNAKMLFNKILETTGAVSAMEISSIQPNKELIMPASPTGGMVGAGVNK